MEGESPRGGGGEETAALDTRRSAVAYTHPVIKPAPHSLAAESWLALARNGQAVPGTRLGLVERGAFLGAGLAQALGEDGMPIEGPADPAGNRVLRYAISSDKPSRSGIQILQSGLDNRDYHGVVLWGHDWGMWESPRPPIGKTLSLTQMRDGEYTRTIAEAEFAGLDQGHEFAEMCFRLGRDGFIPDCSIGCDPLKWTEDEESDLLIVSAWSLIEWSLVPIGDNTDAIKMATAVQSYGLDWRPWVASVESLLDELPAQRGTYISQSKSEAFLRQMGLLGKVTFSGLLDLGPQLLQSRRAEPPAPPVNGKIRESAAEPPPEPAESSAPAPTPAPTEPATEPATEPEPTRDEMRAAIAEGLRRGFLETTGAVVLLEN